MPEVHWCLGGRGQRWQLAGVWVLTQAGVGEAAANWDEAVSSTALHASLSSSLSLLRHSGLPPAALLEWSASLLSPQAVSGQPTAVLLSGLLSKPHVPHQCPVHTGRHTSEAEERRVAHSPPVNGSLSRLPQTGCGTLLQNPSPPFCLSQSPHSEEEPLGAGTSPLLQFLTPSTQTHRPCPASSPFLFSLSSFPVRLGVQGPLPVFSRCCENGSICRCILDASVARCELHILPLCHLILLPPSSS